MLSMLHKMFHSIRNFSYILGGSAYDTMDTFAYLFENTHFIPVIDTNRGRGIVPQRLSVNHRVGIDLRREYASLYYMRWGIKGTFSIIEGIMKTENIWYVKYEDYGTTRDIKTL